MAEKTLLDSDIEAGMKLLAALDRAGYRVVSALWLKRDADADYRLVLASPFVDQTGKGAAYGRISDILRGAELDGILPLRWIEVITPADALIAAIRRAIGTGPRAITRARVTDCNFFGTFVPDALVYRSAPVPAKTRKSSARRRQARPAKVAALKRK